MKTGLVSVIIPTYNRAHTITQAIASALEQTYNDLEVIVVDDCSTDSTAEIVRSIMEKDARVTYLKTEVNSGGPAHPKNMGIKHARGEFIAVLDSDDVWSADKIQKQLTLITDTVSVVGCGYTDTKTTYTVSPKSLQRILIKDYMGPGSCFVYKKEVFDIVGLFDENLKSGQDWDMRIRLVMHGYRIDFCKESLVSYAVQSDSVSARSRSRINKDLRAICRKHIRHLIRHPLYGCAHLLYLAARHLRS